MSIYDVLVAARPNAGEAKRVIASTDRLIEFVETGFAPDLPKHAEMSGSWAKDTEIVGGSDADIFISITSATSATLRELYDELYAWAAARRLAPREQNVSVRVSWEGLSVDLVPGRRQQQRGNDHSLYVRRRRSWTKTNVARHIELVKNSGRTDEIRLMKWWRARRRLDVPSFLIELAVLDALYGKPKDALEDNLVTMLAYLSVRFESARLVDPVNSANVVSDDLTAAERRAVARAADADLAAACGRDWHEVFR